MIPAPRSFSVRLGFAGTPDFSVPTLVALYDWCQRNDSEVVGVWTQPDRPKGRGRKLTQSPVKEIALAHGTPVHQPVSLRKDDALAQLTEARLDLLVVIAYGLILPPAALAAPRLGCVNVHASLLPRWRGAAPIQRAIAAGDTLTGVGIMAMDKGLDTGALWRNEPICIHADDTGGILHDRLASAGAQLLVETLPEILAGVPPVPQDPTMATYAAKLTKAEATVDWKQDAATIFNRLRAFAPWPVAQTTLEGKQFRLWAAELMADVEHTASPGQVLDDRDGIVVACGEGALRLTRVQVAGGRALDAADFVRANPCAGHKLGAVAKA